MQITCCDSSLQERWDCEHKARSNYRFWRRHFDNAFNLLKDKMTPTSDLRWFYELFDEFSPASWYTSFRFAETDAYQVVLYTTGLAASLWIRVMDALHYIECNMCWSHSAEILAGVVIWIYMKHKISPHAGPTHMSAGVSKGHSRVSESIPKHLKVIETSTRQAKKISWK